MSSSIYKYLNIDSTYRNRNLYPYQTNFIIPVSWSADPITDPFKAFDPISNAYPSEISTTQAITTGTTAVLNANASTIENFYINRYLQIGSEYRKITNYDATTKNATLETGFTTDPIPAGTTYYIRLEIPLVSGSVIADTVTDITSIYKVFTDLTINPTNLYRGSFLYFTSGLNTGISRMIYECSNNAITVIKSFPYTPSTGDTFNVLQFSRDNFCPLAYWGTRGMSNPVCYSIELLYLMVPNKILKSGYGGTLDKYPYFILKLSNVETQYSDHALYSNNPNEKSALFRIPMPLTLRSETFFILKDSKCIEVVKFRPDQSLKVELLLPNGDPIIFKTTDNISPEAPNPLIQISASFAIRRIDKE